MFGAEGTALGSQGLGWKSLDAVRDRISGFLWLFLGVLCVL